MDALSLDAQQTILVVEDNPSTRIALEAILEALGYAVLMAVDAREAQTIYQEHGPEISLVMSDLMMPEISGPELFTILKGMNPDVRMVIMSGYPLEDDSALLEERGIRHWMRKPFTMQEAATIIVTALGQELR